MAGIFSNMPALQVAAAIKNNKKHTVQPVTMQLGLDVGVHSTELLSFMKQLGIEWICTTLPTTHGQAVDSSLTKDVVLKGFDGSNGGIGGPPGGLSGPWKKEELADLLLKVQNAGMRLGSLNENQVWKNPSVFFKSSNSGRREISRTTGTTSE
jgi:hypothetical protein